MTRAAVFLESENQGHASVSAIREMENALLELTNQFHGSDEVARLIEERTKYTHFYAADRFLQELDREIIQLQKTGDMRPFRGQSGYAPDSDGAHLVSLLCFMNRNGVEFAPPNPGSEFAYHNLFVLMRGLYLTVAEQDESLQPKNLSKAVRER